MRIEREFNMVRIFGYFVDYGFELLKFFLRRHIFGLSAYNISLVIGNSKRDVPTSLFFSYFLFFLIVHECANIIHYYIA